MRRLLALILFFGLAPVAVGVARADGPPQPLAAASAQTVRRAVVAVVATDSAPALRTCNPAKPVRGDFEFTQRRTATTPGLQAQVISGVVINHCSVAAENLAIEVLATAHGKKIVGLAKIHTYTGVLGPGEAAPFTIMFASGPSPHLTLNALPYKQASGATSSLHVRVTGSTTTPDGNTDVSYVLTNDGQAAATFPRVIGRLNGPACGDPYAAEVVNHANKLAPGQSLSGDLVLPGKCGGSAELYAGSEAPPDPPLPAGWSMRGAQVTYTPDGTMHLVALLCNNSDDFFLFPALRVAFSGAKSTTADIYDTNYYPSGACRPLISAFPNAPAGLQFDHLIAIDSGSGFTGVTAAFAKTFDPWDWAYPEERYSPPDPADFDPFDDPWDIPDPVDIPFPPDDPFEDIPLPPPPPDDPFDGLPDPPSDLPPLPPQVAGAAASGSGVVYSIVYNPTASPQGASDYILLATGTGPDGKVSAGLAITAPPTVPAHSWAVIETPISSADFIHVPGQTVDFTISGGSRPASP